MSSDDTCSSTNPDSLHCLTRGQSVGLAMVVISGFISFTAVFVVFGIIARNVVRQKQRHGKWRVFVEPVDVIVLSIFFGDAILALGAIVNIKWVNDGRVESGPYCTAQGVIKQLGEVSVPLSIMVLAVYTFRGLWMGKTSESLLVTKLLILAIWLFVTLIIVLGHAINKGSYITPVPYWCWIGDDYMHWRIWGEYFWFWLTLVVSILTYIPLFFWVMGKISPHPKYWWRFRIQKDGSAPQELRDQANIMLAYPLVYCITILPLSIVRWIYFQQGRGTLPAPAPNFFSVSILVLSGAFNVTLLLMTRPNTGLFRKDDGSTTMNPLPPDPRVQDHVEGSGSTPSTSYQETPRADEYSLGRLPSH